MEPDWSQQHSTDESVQAGEPRQGVPARRVAEMVELAMRASLERPGAVVALALPLFLLVTIPAALSNWLGYRAAAEMFSQLVGSFSLNNFDPQAFQFYMQGEMPDIEPTGGPIMDLLSMASFVGGVAFGPLVQGALVLLVVGHALGFRVRAIHAWRGATARAGKLILTEMVKAILLGLIVALSALAAFIVLILGGGLLDLIAGGGPAAGIIAVFFFVFVGGMIFLGPAVYFYLLWIYTIPLVLFEGAGISVALERSARMVRYRPAGQGVWDTHPMRLTGLLTLAGLVLLAALLPAASPVLLWLGKSAGRIMEDPTVLFSMPMSVYVAAVLLTVLPQVVLAPVFHGSIALYYLDTRVRDEGESNGGELVREFVETLARGEQPEPALPRAAPVPPHSPGSATGSPESGPSNPGLSNWPDGAA